MILKYIVTSGCSFTAYDRCWPYRLIEQLGGNYSLINDSHGSTGNAFISRRIVYQIGKLLAQGIDPKDIIAGAMWSGANRGNIHDYRIRNIGVDEVNPYYWPKEENIGAWQIFSSSNTSKKALTFYQYIFSYYQSVLETYEYVNSLQNYLNNKGIKYFMCPYMDNWNYNGEHDNEDPYIRMIVDSIDYSKWVTKEGQWDWVTNNAPNLNWYNGTHPGTQQNALWVKEILLPWLTENKYV